MTTQFILIGDPPAQFLLVGVDNPFPLITDYHDGKKIPYEPYLKRRKRKKIDFANALSNRLYPVEHEVTETILVEPPAAITALMPLMPSGTPALEAYSRAQAVIREGLRKRSVVEGRAKIAKRLEEQDEEDLVFLMRYLQ